MNKPNKSIIAMRKAGLVEATAHTPEQILIAERYLVQAYRAHTRNLFREIVGISKVMSMDAQGLAKAISDVVVKTIKAERQAQESYKLGLKGIRIGQEASHGH